MASRAKFRFDLPHDLAEAVREGRKTIDVRVNIQPYADVKKGDVLSYRDAEVVVRRIQGYRSLGDAVAYEDYTRIVPGSKDRNEALARLREYILEDSPPHGLLAIEFVPPRAAS